MQRQPHLGWMIAVLAAFCLALPSAAYAVESDDFPTDPQEAMEHYESDVEEWAEGPVAWIMLEDEEDTWDELADVQAKQEFIDWFWARRDPDLRDEVNPVKQEFYAKVALANDRFNDFPRGWKSDRGRIFITLGPPEGVNALGLATETEGEEWTYLTVGPRALEIPVESDLGEFQVFFVLADGTSYELAGDAGIHGTIPPVVRDAIDYAKEVHVVNPDLEFGMISDRGSS